MKEMKKFFTALGIPFLPSQGNFLLINTRQGFGMSGPEVFEACLRLGVIFRPVANYGLPDWLRVTVGTSVQNRVAQKAFLSLKKHKSR